jgi:hypothetical protein
MFKLNLFSKLNPYAFILSFCIGIFIVYLSEPPKRIIVKHPRPNDDKTIYHDDDDNCYKYKTIEIQCPSDKSLILDHPLEI